MSPFIETIQLLDGELMNIAFHQARFERTRSQVLGLHEHPLLNREIPLPGGLEGGVFKCRVLYGTEIERIEYEPYFKPETGSLRLVTSDSISYGYKYSDRTALAALFRQRGNCDDILIVRQGCITDSYFANVVFWDGDSWITPDTPLLPGTMRASLLADGTITESRIMKNDLGKFQKIRLINALNSLEEGTDIPIHAIRE